MHVYYIIPLSSQKQDQTSTRYDSILKWLSKMAQWFLLTHWLTDSHTANLDMILFLTRDAITSKIFTKTYFHQTFRREYFKKLQWPLLQYDSISLYALNVRIICNIRFRYHLSLPKTAITLHSIGNSKFKYFVIS